MDTRNIQLKNVSALLQALTSISVGVRRNPQSVYCAEFQLINNCIFVYMSIIVYHCIFIFVLYKLNYFQLPSDSSTYGICVLLDMNFCFLRRYHRSKI